MKYEILNQIYVTCKVMNFTRPLISRFPRYVIRVQTHG